MRGLVLYLCTKGKREIKQSREFIREGEVSSGSYMRGWWQGKRLNQGMKERVLGDQEAG